MVKRFLGVLLLLGGLTLTVLIAVVMAMDIPSNFSVEGRGLEALVSLAVKYGLRPHFLFIGLGVAVMLSALTLLLSPRRVKGMVGVAARAEAVAPAEMVDVYLPAEETATESDPRLVQEYHTNLLGTAFANAGGRSRQQILRETRAGDVVVCRTVAMRSEEETETVGVFTVKGEQMGIVDQSLLRSIRQKYPDHRIGLTVERISGGRGVPYTCALRVEVYRV